MPSDQLQFNRCDAKIPIRHLIVLYCLATAVIFGVLNAINPVNMKQLLCVLLSLFIGNTFAQTTPAFTLEELKAYPFPNELTASPSGARIAWALQK